MDKIKGINDLELLSILPQDEVLKILRKAQESPSPKRIVNFDRKKFLAQSKQKYLQEQKELQKIRNKLKDLERSMQKANQAATAVVVAKRIQAPTDDDLRERYHQEQLNKMAQSLKVPQYGRVYLQTKNNPG